MNAVGSAPPGMINLKIKDAAQLYASYMPFLKNGGLFAPTIQRYGLGDEVVLLVTLIEESERLSVPGRVVWITPVGAQGNRTAGIGVQFTETDKNEAEVVRAKIEVLLASMAGAERPTHTM